MSFDAVRPYFRARAESLDYDEWKDGFNFNNIPATQLDRSFHLGPVGADAVDLNQQDQTMIAQITVRLFFKGFRNSAQAIDAAASSTSAFIKDALCPANRLTIGDDITNMRVLAVDVVPLDDSNDNAARADMLFGADVVLNLE